MNFPITKRLPRSVAVSSALALRQFLLLCFSLLVRRRKASRLRATMAKLNGRFALPFFVTGQSAVTLLNMNLIDAADLERNQSVGCLDFTDLMIFLDLERK